MKKILYPIFAISTMLFATSCKEGMNDNRGTTTEVVGANDDENVDPEHIRDYGTTPGASATTGDTDADEQYRADADELTAQVTTDLKLDDQTKERVQQVYYNRNKKLGDLRQGNNSSAANRMNSNTSGSDLGTGGTNTDAAPIEPNTIDTLRADANAGTNNSATMSATDTEAARKHINDEADRQLQAILTPEQWNLYQQNRTRYNAMK